jgi:hypothetical protein
VRQQKVRLWRSSERPPISPRTRVSCDRPAARATNPLSGAMRSLGNRAIWRENHAKPLLWRVWQEEDISSGTTMWDAWREALGWRRRRGVGV